MRRGLLRTGLVTVLAATGLAVQGVPSASASTAVQKAVLQPRSSSGCEGIWYQVCIDIHGKGLYVGSIEATEVNIELTRNAHYEFTGPQGFIKNDDRTYDGVWGPMHNEPAGQYCVTLWEANSTYTGWTDLGKACAMVHA